MDIKLSELDLKITMYSFYNTLLNNNIRTVRDVLDDEKMNPILERLRKQARDELRGFIDLMKHQFAGQALTADIYLEQKMRPLTDKEKETITQKGLSAIDYPINFPRMAITTREAMALYIIYMVNQKHSEKDLRLIDVFKLYLNGNDKESTLSRKIRIYLDSFEKNHASDVELNNLKKQLAELTQKRDGLNLQIAKTEERIKAYEEIKGSMNK